MRHLKLLILALAVLGAITATAADTALALPTVLPEALHSWTGKSTSQFEILNPGGVETTCAAATAEGTLEEGRPSGLFHLHFKECIIDFKGTEAECTGEGEETGVILVLGTWHFVYDTLSTSLSSAGVAMLFSLGAVKYECGSSSDSIEVKPGGMALCLIPNPTALTRRFEFHCTKAGSAHRPAETKYYDGGGTLVGIAPILSSQNGEPTIELTLVGSLAVEFKEDALIMI